MGELQEYLAEHARREQYALLDTPRVLVTTDDDLAVGEFGIATRLVAAEGPAESAVPAELASGSARADDDLQGARSRHAGRARRSSRSGRSSR